MRGRLALFYATIASYALTIVGGLVIGGALTLLIVGAFYNFNFSGLFVPLFTFGSIALFVGGIALETLHKLS